MNNNKPFWQVLLLSVVTSGATGAVAYYSASNDGKGAAAQTWATTNLLLESYEARLHNLERDRHIGHDHYGPNPVSVPMTSLVPEEEFEDFPEDAFDPDRLGVMEDAGVAKPKPKKTKKRAKKLPAPGDLLPMDDDRVQKARQMY